ncbi:hypothetical protein [Amnibacterium sp.]|uniref:hypothetical protein n=1 Tax=Amnibacterium sp. TaxID=1872496 RepID=UPI002617BDAC|nr:hypothetical protein [Amnibacterium sp.]MCU1473398.1 hypothetical protein [Amnibacterium sp.]
MKGKLLFVAGLATGYVVGSRAGRSAYTTLTEKLRAARESDRLQSVVGKVKEVAQERAPKLTAAVSTAADTTSSVADAVAAAPDPESGSEDEATAESSTSTPEEPKPSTAKRVGRSRAASTPTAPDSAEEAAHVFEEQLPESGGAIDDSASGLPTEGGTADESATPTATS